MEFDEKILAVFRKCLSEPDPIGGLRSALREFLDAQYSRESLVAHLMQLRQELQAKGDEISEDALLDVLDFLTGFCSPHMRL
jgi:hypothetical protein